MMSRLYPAVLQAVPSYAGYCGGVSSAGRSVRMPCPGGPGLFASENHDNGWRVTGEDRLGGRTPDNIAGGSGSGGRGGSGGRSGSGGGGSFGGLPPRRPRFRMWRNVLGSSLAVLLLGTAVGGIVIWKQYSGIVAGLPTVDGLRSYEPLVMSRLYSGDDRLIAELAAERRIFVPYSAIPDRVKNAFLAAEDHKFWTHAGVDPLAIIRAGLTDMTRGKGHRPMGASTITQQVARIMLIGNNAVSFQRKAREALLAMRIEQVLPKEKILEIYLNEIYLGDGAYGIAAAAQTYFAKPLDQLDDAEAAVLASLPKSPTNYNPLRYPDAARMRRNLVLGEMVAIGAISREAATAAQAEPIIAKNFHRPGPVPGSEWFGEEVRRELIERYGTQQTMQGGLNVHTSLDPALQSVATDALRDGLAAYDRSHGGWRGPVNHLDGITAGTEEEVWMSRLATTAAPAGMPDRWRLAVVLDSARGSVGWIEGTAASGSPRHGLLLARDLGWMRVFRATRPGDVLMVEPQAEENRVAIRQIPRIEGAAVTMDVHTGRVLAMVGGWSFAASQFNRATQALRQPGSSFKPFVYLAAMEQGISPSQQFEDSAVSYGSWHPNNYEKDFWGPTTLHDALRESRNLVTIRLAAHIGMKSVARIATDVGLVETMPHVLPAALGAVETTVLREAGAYATIANGGQKVTPTLIDDVQDRNGHVIWRPAGLALTTAQPDAPPPAPGAVPDAVFPAADQGGAEGPSTAVSPVQGSPAQGASPGAGNASSATPPAPALVVPGRDAIPAIADVRAPIASADSAFQITTMLQDVIRRGTGIQAGQGIDHPIAGKTGTSQDFNDAWFAGYSADLVTVVWIGFDTPQSIGKNETGGAIAGPIWNRIMKTALAGRPSLDFRVPDGDTLVRYDTGRGVTVDAFKQDQSPGQSSNFAGTAGTGELTAADTGAENLPDSESDMVSVAEQQPPVPGKPGIPGAPAAPPPSKQPAGGDIGMGGLY
ncbi:penicillin-binding protein 1A [Acetobacter musti]|nr:PBP1A family penicillin-binding protein [Acetobacter musti]